MRVDLHIHTTASDGCWTPEELVWAVQQQGIELFAVTDHDTVKNIETVRQLADNAGVSFIPGVELCSTHQGQTFHILGYGINLAASSLKRILKINTELMEEADYTSIQKLISQGMPIDYDEYLEYQHNPQRGGWKSLSFLTDKGLCSGVSDFFARLFTVERDITFPDFLPPSEVIAAIVDAGGVPILAHPGSAFHGATLEDTLKFFMHEDIKGIECFHPGHDEATTQLALEWCKRNGLLITGGSDCHGGFVPRRHLGIPNIELNQLQLGELQSFIR